MTAYLSPHHHHHHHNLRTYSNKENTPSISASPSPTPSVFELTDIDAISTSLQTSLSGVSNDRSKKAIGLGLGRAPKFQYRKHNSKPYQRERVSSIQRAKKSINRLPSSSKQNKSNNKKGLKSRPTPLKLKDAQKERLNRNNEEEKKLKVMDRVRLERWRKSIWKPTNHVQGQVRVPLMLPYPKFPPVPPIDTDELRNIPNGYILDRLTPVLPSISTITLAYRPYATIPHPDPTVQAGSTLPLAIPEVLAGSKPHWAEKARGREPDMVLGIMKKGAEGEKGKMIVPVMSMVFATQCAYWPKLTTPPTSSSSSSSIASSSRIQPTPSEAAVSTSLPAIIESSESDIEKTSNHSWSSESDSESDDEPQLPQPILDFKGFLHLPIIPLPLPSPETFGIIHRHLHHPNRPFIPDLLGLTENCITRERIVEELSGTSVQQLMTKLEVLQGIWQNLCCLGIGKLSTWKQLGESWACVVGIIAGNGILLKNIPEPQNQEEDKGKARTAAEEVAWNWVRIERSKFESQPSI